ncbi:hypothetical protein MYP_665 [Sporocytophaga myxococcoides]|uniref:Uncharacterized protein n=1 Tax=Sporocytophaga myxococcoides TaxID=153721 RepID=A0A098LB80_9BACT|nr:hypothetical protein [Sporocytophaga myxococcoides]GAL83438.1 hypothetical protein MYP_665 [Sporocytophaga myxococcoides]
MIEEEIKLGYYKDLIQQHETLVKFLKEFIEENKESDDLELKIKCAKFDIEVTEIVTKLYFYKKNFDHYLERVSLYAEQRTEDLEKMKCLANWQNLITRLKKIQNENLTKKIKEAISSNTYSKEYDLWKKANQLLSSHNL